MGTSTTTGDGGMTQEERKSSKYLVYQLLPSRYGMNPDDLRKADAIEVVVGQGAKPGGGAREATHPPAKHTHKLQANLRHGRSPRPLPHLPLARVDHGAGPDARDQAAARRRAVLWRRLPPARVRAAVGGRQPSAGMRRPAACGRRPAGAGGRRPSAAGSQAPPRSVHVGSTARP